MKKKLPIFFFWFLSCLYLSAQQTPQYSLYMFNQAGQNPAAAGTENTLIATGIYRTQWAGLEGAPVTQIVTAHMPLAFISSGIGINIENDETGASQRTAATLSYNYQVNINRQAILSIGINGGILQQSIDGNALRTPEGTYDPDQNIILHNDNLLSIETMTTSLPIFSAGVFFKNEKIEAGLGVLNLQQPTVKFNDLSLELRRSYYLTASYLLELSRTLTLRPTSQIKSDITQTQVELSAVLGYQEKFYLGGSYRGFGAESLDAAVILAGIKLNENWQVGYAYDLTLSPLKAVSNGSHEIMLQYNFGRPIGQGVPPPIIFNPRY